MPRRRFVPIPSHPPVCRFPLPGSLPSHDGPVIILLQCPVQALRPDRAPGTHPESPSCPRRVHVLVFRMTVEVFRISVPAQRPLHPVRRVKLDYLQCLRCHSSHPSSVSTPASIAPSSNRRTSRTRKALLHKREERTLSFADAFRFILRHISTLVLTITPRGLFLLHRWALPVLAVSALVADHAQSMAGIARVVKGNKETTTPQHPAQCTPGTSPSCSDTAASRQGTLSAADAAYSSGTGSRPSGQRHHHETD